MSNSDYRMMFKELSRFYPKKDDLDKLATVMSGKLRFPDAILNRIDKSFSISFERGIPSGYTYLAQFIAHDITFDSKSDRHIREDFPDDIITKESLKNLKNLRNLSFDLETIYGFEKSKDGSEIPRNELLLSKPALPMFKLGSTHGSDSGTASKSFPNDLPRKNACVEANIADPRNDENLLLSQTQVAFMKFHNALVVKLNESGVFSRDELFEKARKLTIRYYQTIILTDLLPRILRNSVIEDVRSKLDTDELFYQPKPDDSYLPLEFSVAANRFAHSMIRNDYDLNARNKKISLIELMKLTGKGEMLSTPSPGRSIHLSLPSIWIFDWNLFYDFGHRAKNTAEKIDTKMSPCLLTLRPKPRYDSGGRGTSLALLDLYRGRRFGLPSGQDVAKKIKKNSALTVKQLTDLINAADISEGTEEEIRKTKERLIKVFSKKTPLWFYILAEAEIARTEPDFANIGKLGEVGSRIVAEVFLQILNISDFSILQYEWEDDEKFLLSDDKSFSMPDMLNFIRDVCLKNHKKLYPRKYYPCVKNKFDELNPLEKGYEIS